MLPKNVSSEVQHFKLKSLLLALSDMVEPLAEVCF